MPAQNEDYACTNCGAFVDRDDVSVKKVTFASIGSRGNVFRTRTTQWLCFECLGADEDYNAPGRVTTAERLEVARSKRQARAKQKSERG